MPDALAVPATTPVVPAVPAVPAADASVAAAVAIAAKPPTPAPVVVPDTYTFTPPAGVTLDPAFVERTAAAARTLGLSNEAGQKLLETTLTEAAAREAAFVESWQPNTGAEWKKQEATWRAAALADPTIGGSQEKLNNAMELGQKVLTHFKATGITEFLGTSGLGSKPEVIRFLAAVGKAMSESTLVRPGSQEGGGVKSLAERLYPNQTAAA